MTHYRCLTLYAWFVSLLAPATGLAQRTASRFTIDNKSLSIRADRGFVEAVVDERLPAARRAALVQTLSVSQVAPTRLRVLIHPDSLARFLDSAETAIAEQRARHPTTSAAAEIGTPATFILAIGEAPAQFGRWLGGFRLQGCSVPATTSNVDSVTYQALIQSLRRAIRQARSWRRRERRTVDQGIVCGARLLAESVVVPTITRRDISGASSADAVVDAVIDSNGAVARLQWRDGAPRLEPLDSAMYRWRFQPATGAQGRRADRATFRVRYGVDDPRVELDSLVRLLAPAAATATSYSVIGHVIDEHSTRTVLAGDVDLHVDDGGARFGAPVVIALGAGGRVAQLSAVLEHLRQQRRVITYDPRGHGQSSLAHDYSIEAQVRDLTTILDSLHLDHVVLAGVGSGGIAAAEAARRQPQRVIGVALLGPAGDYLLEDAPRANVVDSIRRVMSSSGSPPALSRFFLPADSLILGWVIRDLRSTPLDAVLGVLDASARYDFAPAMEEYHGPRMILLPSGSAGPLRPPLAAARDSIVRETYASGRWLYLTAAAEVSRRLEAFVYAAEWMHRQ